MVPIPDALGLRLGSLRALKLVGLSNRWAYRMLAPGVPGKAFTIGRDSCVLAREMRIGRGVSIGRGCDITVDHLDLADGVCIGDSVKIRTKKLVMGVGSRIDSHTTVHGLASARSSLVLGERAWIFANCYVNTDDSVTIGARSAAGSHTMIFSHSSFLPITQGYPVTFAPVEIGSDVWLPWHAFILPGSRIGDGATVGAFSLVSGDVPADSLAVGVPARVVKDASNFRRRYDASAILRLAERVIEEVLAQLEGGFRPRELFFPVTRSFERRGEREWLVTIGTDSARVILLAPGEQQGFASFDGTPLVVVTCGFESPPSGARYWCDLVTQRSELPTSGHRAIIEIASGFSRWGIRFAWHARAVGQADALEIE